MTKEQERARAHRRQDKLDAKAAQRERDAARNRQVAVVVAAVLVVVVAFVVLASKLGGDSTPAASPSASSSPSASASTAAVEGCEAPPATPTAITTQGRPDKATAAGKTFTAVVTTNCGDITQQLDGSKAPQTVASFVGLA